MPAIALIFLFVHFKRPEKQLPIGAWQVPHEGWLHLRLE